MWMGCSSRAKRKWNLLSRFALCQSPVPTGSVATFKLENSGGAGAARAGNFGAFCDICLRRQQTPPASSERSPAPDIDLDSLHHAHRRTFLPSPVQHASCFWRYASSFPFSGDLRCLTPECFPFSLPFLTSANEHRDSEIEIANTRTPH